MDASVDHPVFAPFKDPRGSLQPGADPVGVARVADALRTGKDNGR
ncbi:MAG TPA: hypothetical protein VGO86_18875 [Candidatus Dormibacteraeota bacterium]